MWIFEISKFSISFPTNLAETEQIKKTLEQNLNNEEDFNAYNFCELELENIYDRKAKGEKICSKCEWYQHGAKPTKFFLNFEEQKAINAIVRHLIDDIKDITDVKKINACICKFYKNIFRTNVSKSDLERESLLNSIGLPNLNSKCVDICESEITEKVLITALKVMLNGKFSGHGGLNK